MHWSVGLLGASCPTRLRLELFSAVGDLAHRAGFMAFDAGAHDDASRVFRFALACAEKTDDWPLTEHALVRADRLTETVQAMLPDQAGQPDHPEDPRWRSENVTHERDHGETSPIQRCSMLDAEVIRGMPIRDRRMPTPVPGSPPPASGAQGTAAQWGEYRSPGCWDEMLVSGRARVASSGVIRYLGSLGDELIERQKAAELAIKAMGITFTVYSDADNRDRAWPFDVIPRVISTQEWNKISDGLVQRLTALNMFIDDLYGKARVVTDGVLPAEVLANSPNFRPQCAGVRPPGGIWAHICGSDLVRDADGTIYVLEDNLRVPSGVSYMLENRLVTKRVFADLFRDLDIHPVDSYPNKLHTMLAALSPRRTDWPTIAVLTPGVHNSAYFEHVFLARQMGAYLVEGGDLLVDDDRVYVGTISGPVRVDVIYRRVDDLWLDPEVFRSDSQVGVPGLIRAWRVGNVAIANAPGAGVADDKAIYAYVPRLIRYYLGEDPKIANVPTYLCHADADRAHVLAHLDELVVKPANESGGYGIFIGPRASSADKEEIAARIEADPRNYVAQPTLSLSTAPTLCAGRIVPRHVDLRPFILSGERAYVTQGGLTRVALVENSLIVNSSQGGGSKDTWVLDPTVASIRNG
ncbi:MAG TPA: circularly permuted type 2 ATP-grasp protein [Pseudonocardiaceae bacterium]|nr:circularly permuted type 2 ATP-grasp protein [Pseudonocardiaceae bacterium]